jgi:hypothetical protein
LSAKKTNRSAQATTLAQIVAALEEALDSLGAAAAPLTIDARRRLPKMRPGIESLAPGIKRIADGYKAVLPGEDTVLSDLQLIKDLRPVLIRLHAAIGRVADMDLNAKARLSKWTMAMYVMLSRVVVTFPELQRELEPMASFLATKYKDAPTAIRPQEKNALARARKRAKKNAKT